MIGPLKAFNITMASGSTLTSAVDLGGSYGNIMVEIPSLASGTDVRFQVSDASDGTFRQLYFGPEAASTDPVIVNIKSSITQCYFPLKMHAQHIKVEHTTAMTATSAQFKILCSAN